MLFSVNYKSKHKQETDEIRCPINQLGLIFDFIKANPDKRYNVIIDDSTDIKKLVEQVEFVKGVASDYTIECSQITTAKSLIDEGYNAYLRFPVVDWETVHGLISLGVSDIYIDGPLGFQCDALSKIANPPIIRVSPTVSPNAAINEDTNVNSFFIRPEDIPVYDDCLTEQVMIDFHVSNQDKEDALFDIYKRGTFNFNLRQLVESLQIDAPNFFIPQAFAQNRLNCGQKCKIPGRGCHLCDKTLALANRITQIH